VRDFELAAHTQTTAFVGLGSNENSPI